MKTLSKTIPALVLMQLTLSAFQTNAATFMVTNTNDSGVGSLRQAMINANAAAGADDIVFDPVVFSTPQTITVTSTLTFNSTDNLPLTITGPGANLLTISGGDTDRIFSVTSGDTGSLSGLTLTRAVTSAISNSGTLTVTNVTFHDNTAGNGGAINNTGLSLTVIGCTFTANDCTSGSATGLGGGAIYSSTSTGTVTITNSTFTGNEELGGSGGGGAIRNRTGTMMISNSTFSSNTTVAGGGAIVNSDIMSMTGCSVTGNSTPASGGGLSNAGQLTMANTVLSGNTANVSGGGISNNSFGALTVTDSTISNNTATTGTGGGISLAGANNTISNTTISGNMAPGVAGDGGGIRTTGSSNLNNVTVSGNMAGRDAGGIHASGTSGNITNITSCTIVNNTATRDTGGVWRVSTTNPVNLRNSIFANNTDDGTAPDLRGTVVSQGYNLIKTTTGATITGDTTTNIVGQDPQLRPLSNNGGPTLTHALQLTSPAIDKGDSSSLTTDQRGFARPTDAPGIPNVSDGADIGAVEARPPTAVDDVPNTNEDNAVVISVLANDFDVDNDAFTIVEVTQGTNGAVSTNGTTVTYTPNPNFFGSDSFTYRTSDTIFQSNVATVNVTVNPINDAPSFTRGADQTVNEDAGAQTVSGWATNISQGPNETGQTLTFNIETTQTTGGLTFSSGPSIDPAAGTLSYTPAPDANGTATLSVTLSDNGSNTPPNVNTSAAQTFTITVNAVNDPPTLNAISDPVAIPEDSGQQTINLTGISVGPANEAGQVLSVTASSSNTALIPNPTVTYSSPSSTGSLSYTPASNQFGSAVITVTVQDNGGGANSVMRTFTVNVTPVNDAPVITGQMPVSTEYNTPRAIMFSDLQVTDIDNTYPTGFTLTAMDGVNYTRSGNTITPAANFFGTLLVPVKVNDGGLDSNTYQLEFAVNPRAEDVRSKVKVEKEPGGGYRITFIGNPGQQYTVQFSSSLAPANWQFLSQPMAGPQGTYFVIDNSPAGTARFYRAIVP